MDVNAKDMEATPDELEITMFKHVIKSGRATLTVGILSSEHRQDRLQVQESLLRLILLGVANHKGNTRWSSKSA